MVTHVDGVAADADVGIGKNHILVAHVKGVAAEAQKRIVAGQDHILVAHIEGVAMNGDGACAVTQVGQYNIGIVIVAKEKGVAADAGLQRVVGELQVVDKIAQTGGCTLQAVVVVAPSTEAWILLVVDKIVVNAAGIVSIVCIRHSQNLLGGGKDVVVTALGVNLAEDIVGTIAPVDAGKFGGVLAHDEGEQTVGIGVDATHLLVDSGASLGPTEDTDTHADGAVLHKLASGVAHHSLIIKSLWHLSEDGETKSYECDKGGK